MRLLESHMQMKKDKLIYFHDVMNCVPDNLVGQYLYSGRALGLTEDEDMIQIHPDLQHEAKYIFEHYNRIGLSYTKKILWDISLNTLEKYPDHILSPFFFDDGVHQIRPDAARFNVTNYINNKNNFVTLAKKLGVPVPETLCFASKSEISDIHKFHFPCYLKSGVSAGGYDIYQCKNEKDLIDSLAKFKKNIPIQLQREVHSDTFLNVQYRVTKKGLQRLAVTKQILDGFFHIGNSFPVDFEVWDIVDPIAIWLYSKGIKGIFAFDIAVTKDCNNIRYFAIECNPRFNGASYPTIIASKLDLKHWVTMNLDTDHLSLATLDIKDIEYKPETKTGIIIVNWGTILAGKLGILVSGIPQIQENLLDKIRRRL